ncbi:MAG: tetratricopeptide repeat protein [Planctomycetota bacterium]
MSNRQLDKARDCVKKKNFEYAVHWYLQHLKAVPDDVEARRELRAAERSQKRLGGKKGFFGKAKAKMLESKAAVIRVNAKDPEKTMLQCEELLKQDPDLVPALLRLGEAASYAKHEEVAIMAFEDALTVDKNCKEGLRLLGHVYENNDQLDKALKCFQRLNKIDPKDKEAMDKCKNLPARMTSMKVQEGVQAGGFQNLIDKDEAQKLARRSTRVRTAEQAIERIADLEEELKAAPDNVGLMKQLAELCLKADQPAEAIQWCERALEQEPDNEQMRSMKGDLVLKRQEKLVTKLEAAARKDANYKAKWAQAKKKYMAMQIQEFKRRVDAKPTEYSLRFELGKVLFDANQIDAAIPELQKAKSDPRKKAEAGYYLGRCFISKKIYKMAVREFKTATADLFEMEGIKKEITYYLGRIYEQAGQKANAIAEYEAIAEVDFNYRDVTQRLESLS